MTQIPTDTLVRTVRTCVSGSDLHRCHSLPEHAKGRSMGHELIAAVEEAGPEAADERLLASLLALSDVYLAGFHATHAGQVGPGTTATVIGDGAVGPFTVLAAHRHGAERIRHIATARADALGPR